jgi:hypothetical protein
MADRSRSAAIASSRSGCARRGAKPRRFNGRCRKSARAPRPNVVVVKQGWDTIATRLESNKTAWDGIVLRLIGQAGARHSQSPVDADKGR